MIDPPKVYGQNMIVAEERSELSHSSLDKLARDAVKGRGHRFQDNVLVLTRISGASEFA